MRLKRVAGFVVAFYFAMVLGLTVFGQDSQCEDAFVEQIMELLEDRNWEGIVTTASEAQAKCAISQDSFLYRITINAGTNIRDAAGIPSSILGKAQQGVEYDVFSETEGDQYTWLEIVFAGETAYVASSLTTRLPDFMLEEGGDPIAIQGTNCLAYHSTQRHRRISIHVVFYNDADDEIYADIYKPGATSPVPIYRSDYDAQTDGTYQRYSQWWSEGVYTLELEAKDSGLKTVMGFTIDGTKTNFLGVGCRE